MSNAGKGGGVGTNGSGIKGNKKPPPPTATLTHTTVSASDVDPLSPVSEHTSKQRIAKAATAANVTWGSVTRTELRFREDEEFDRVFREADTQMFRAGFKAGSYADAYPLPDSDSYDPPLDPDLPPDLASHSSATEATNTTLGRLGIAKYEAQRAGQDELAEQYDKTYDIVHELMGHLDREQRMYREARTNGVHVMSTRTGIETCDDDWCRTHDKQCILCGQHNACMDGYCLDCAHDS